MSLVGIIEHMWQTAHSSAWHKCRVLGEEVGPRAVTSVRSRHDGGPQTDCTQGSLLVRFPSSELQLEVCMWVGDGGDSGLWESFPRERMDSCARHWWSGWREARF